MIAQKEQDAPPTYVLLHYTLHCSQLFPYHATLKSLGPLDSGVQCVSGSAMRMLMIGLLALLRCHDLGDDVNPSSG